MLVLPCALSVAAVVRMMKYMTRLEKHIPVMMSVMELINKMLPG
jgi:hypothetical protein